MINNFNIGEDPVTTSNLATTSMYQHHFKEPSSQQPQSPNMHHNAEPSSPSLLSYKPSQVPSQHRQSFELIQRQKEMEQQKLIDQIQDYSNLNIDGSTPLSAIASRPFPKPPSQDDAMPTWLTAGNWLDRSSVEWLYIAFFSQISPRWDGWQQTKFTHEKGNFAPTSYQCNALLAVPAYSGKYFFLLQENH